MPFAKIEGRDLHYTDTAPTSKNASGLSIVFVHGLGSTQNFYGPILPYLTDYRCVTFDNYAAGRSKHLPASEVKLETSIEQIGADVIGIMDHLKIEKAILVGYSMGGMVPTTVASSQQGRDRVIAGICIGPVHPSPQVAKVFRDRVSTVQSGKQNS